MNAPTPMVRLTTQRQIILEELAKTQGHPTANDVYDIVRKILPRIGLGTVYRNLEIMADNGMIQKIERGGSKKRFDATTKPHYHLRCSQCGKVENMDVEVNDALVTAAAKSSLYQILGHNAEFLGICRNCQ